MHGVRAHTHGPKLDILAVVCVTHTRIDRVEVRQKRVKATWRTGLCVEAALRYVQDTQLYAQSP